tara:strand:+ start:17326 stop:17769 length:444 start_codon:yes stop_codon:yes gene_type:complete
MRKTTKGGGYFECSFFAVLVGRDPAGVFSFFSSSGCRDDDFLTAHQSHSSSISTALDGGELNNQPTSRICGVPEKQLRQVSTCAPFYFATTVHRLALSLDVLERKSARGPLAIEWQPVIASITGLNRRRTLEKSPREGRDYGLNSNE